MSRERDFRVRTAELQLASARFGVIRQLPDGHRLPISRIVNAVDTARLELCYDEHDCLMTNTIANSWVVPVGSLAEKMINWDR